MVTTIGQRVKQRRKLQSMSQDELAREAGLTQPTISALEREGGSNSSGSLAQIAHALKVRALWLETGLGEPELDPVELAKQSQPRDAEVFTIPLLDCRGSCGNGNLSFEVDFSPIAVCTRVLKKYNVKPQALIALYADGDSMSNFIIHGDILFFDTAIDSLKDGGIYLLETPDGLRVKRLHRRIDGKVVLRSDSLDKQRYPDEEYSAEQASNFMIKGKFVFRIGG